MRLVVKHNQVGYQTPGERPGCRNCTYVEPYRPESGVCYNISRLTCTRHYIEVTSGGICPDYRQDESHQVFLHRRGKGNPFDKQAQFPMLGRFTRSHT